MFMVCAGAGLEARIITAAVSAVSTAVGELLACKRRRPATTESCEHRWRHACALPGPGSARSRGSAEEVAQAPEAVPTRDRRAREMLEGGRRAVVLEAGRVLLTAMAVLFALA